MAEEKHIFALKDKMSRENKEEFLNQRSLVIWLFGLSGSGKSTIAKACERFLEEKEHYTVLVDGDDLRSGINSGLGFSMEDRKENLRRAAEIGKLFLNNGAITICSFITPTEELRNMVKNIIGEKDLLQVFVSCSLEECQRRDVKGLYKLAKADKISNFTGIGSDFEKPTVTELVVRTETLTVEDCVLEIYNKIKDRITLPKV